MNVFNHDNNTQNIYDLENKVIKQFIHSYTGNFTAVL